MHNLSTLCTLYILVCLRIIISKVCVFFFTTLNFDCVYLIQKIIIAIFWNERKWCKLFSQMNNFVAAFPPIRLTFPSIQLTVNDGIFHVGLLHCLSHKICLAYPFIRGPCVNGERRGRNCYCRKCRNCACLTLLLLLLPWKWKIHAWNATCATKIISTRVTANSWRVLFLMATKEKYSKKMPPSIHQRSFWIPVTIEYGGAHFQVLLIDNTQDGRTENGPTTKNPPIDQCHRIICLILLLMCQRMDGLITG